MSRSRPNTAPGKARVSKNAVTHGIMSPSPVLTGLEEEAGGTATEGQRLKDPTMEDIEEWMSSAKRRSTSLRTGRQPSQLTAYPRNTKNTKQFPDANNLSALIAPSPY